MLFFIIYNEVEFGDDDVFIIVIDSFLIFFRRESNLFG